MAHPSEAFDLTAYMEMQRKRVEAALEQRMAAFDGRAPSRLLESMRYSLLAGGKRLRPILCLTFAEQVARASGAGGRPAEDAACALEMIHTYSLVHDDLPAMDDDDLRRGQPTNHKVFGEALAILAGDALLTEAFGLVASGDEPVRVALCRELARVSGAAGMVGGQVYDTAEDRPAEKNYLMRLHHLKTGALIRGACRMGVLSVGGSQAQLEAADKYGDAVGLAFQIADDLLDLESTPEELGKPAGADAAAGRFTFPAVFGLEESKQMAQELARDAAERVKPIEGPDGPLAALARYSVERKK